MADCIFCKIIAGEIPAARIYEDDETVAFLDIHPSAKGHTLIVPKSHVKDLLEAGPSEIAAVLKTAQRIAPAILKATNSEGFNIAMNNGAAAGQVVFHWHTHLIPRTTGDGLKFWPEKSYVDGEAEELGKKIQELLEMND